MKAPSIGILSFGFAGLTALVLLAVGTPDSRVAPAPPPPAAAPPPSVSAGDFMLASTSVDLPIDNARYPDGPFADIVNESCTSCHSASMALTQPPLSAGQWKAEVTKMRETYKAPVPESAIPNIVAYLTAMSVKQADAPAGTVPLGKKVAKDDPG